MNKLLEHTLKMSAFLFMLYFLVEHSSLLPIEAEFEEEELILIMLAMALLIVNSFVRSVYEYGINIKGYQSCPLTQNINQYAYVGIGDGITDSKAEQIELVGLHD